MKYLNYLKIVGVAGTLFGTLFWYQNCGRSALDGMDTYSSVDLLDFSEDDLFLKLQNGQATVAELNYSLTRYVEFLPTPVAAMNAIGAEAGRSGQIPIGEAIRMVTNQINKVVSELRNLLFEQRLATNSPEVLKKYTELVDLLSRARDLNNYLILTADIGDVRRSTELNRQAIIELRRDFQALQDSLIEVRTRIIPALQQELQLRITEVANNLTRETQARQQAIQNLNNRLEQESDTRERQILALRQDLLNQINLLSQQLSQERSTRMTEIQGLSLRLNQLNIQLEAESGARRAEIAGLRDQLQTRVNQLNTSLAQEINRRESQIQSLNGQLKQLNDELKDTAMALRQELDTKLLTLRNDLSRQIHQVNQNVQNEINAVRAIAQSNLVQIKGIQETLIVLSQQVRDTSDRLKQLSEQIAKDINFIQAELDKIRTQGNANYQEMVANWDCSVDMINRGGFEFYGQSAFQKLGLSVSQACIQQKEQVLYAICTERYPVFCGECKNYSDPKNCPAWQQMSGKDRLEILLNIRQEVAIHYLNQQSKLHSQAIYGGEACQIQCLTGISDPEVQSVISGLVNPGNSSNNQCSANAWRK